MKATTNTRQRRRSIQKKKNAGTNKRSLSLLIAQLILHWTEILRAE